MLVHSRATFLLGSSAPDLLTEAESILATCGAQMVSAGCGEALLAQIKALHAPALVLIDAELQGMEMGQLLAAAREDASRPPFPLVVILSELSEKWLDRITQRAVDDVILRTATPLFWRLGVERVQRAFHQQRELEQLREAAAQNAQIDALTGIYNRTTLLSMLFRETDRVQRMSGSLCLILFDVDDFGHWNSRLGAIACDDLLLQVVTRVGRLLRSYDLFGRVGKDEFLVALPGCSAVNAMMLAERIRAEVFEEPFHVRGTAVRLSACFGVAPSRGRSPVVVLRDAEQALLEAKAGGHESIESSCDAVHPEPHPVAFLSPTSGDDLLAW
ncbi:MAG TPA: GGDEF domain-containing protein [Terracidiphilus sp.]|jgi:diguanylate cyclase (GGDEF)-like protein